MYDWSALFIRQELATDAATGALGFAAFSAAKLLLPRVAGWADGKELAFGALVLRLTSLAFGEPRGSAAPAEASYLPMFAHFALVLTAGIYLPRPLVVWFQHVANLLG